MSALRRFFCHFIILAIVMPEIHALTAPAGENSGADSYYRIELNKGSVLIARKVGETAETLTLITAEGITINVEKRSIVSMKEADFDTMKQKYQRRDPNYSRLLFSPTGRPLKEGEGYISDYYIILPGVAYGMTDNISLSGGVSILPSPGFLKNQVVYIAPRIGTEINSRWAVSGGFLAGFPTSTENINGYGGLLYGVGTYGPRDKSLTLGVAYGFISFSDTTRESPTSPEVTSRHYQDSPIVMLGGNIRLSNSVSLVSENWLVMKNKDTLKISPFGLAVRLFGDNLAVDLGFIFIYPAIRQGTPIPWLSFIYNY